VTEAEDFGARAGWLAAPPVLPQMGGSEGGKVSFPPSISQGCWELTLTISPVM
jgi:hypothetical protein